MGLETLFVCRVLTAAINMIKPVKTRILDKVFPNKVRLLTDAFQWDIESGSETLLSNLRSGDAAQIASLKGRSTVTCNGTRFAEKRLIRAADIAKMRAFGEQVAVELLSERTNKELADIRRKVDLTREFMAAKAVQGVVVDAAGVTLVDYGFSGANAPTLAAKNKWTDGESNPIKNIRAWKKTIIQAVGEVDAFFAFCGTAAMDALLSNPAVQELIKYRMGDMVAEQGTIAHLAGVDIEEILTSYLDSGSVRQPMIPDNKFILVGVSAQNAGEIYAPPEDFDDPNGVNTGRPASMFFAKSWVQEDPSGRWIKGEARPLPVLFKPECIVSATVI